MRKEGALEYFVVEEFATLGLLEHAFTTRRGGVSSDDFSELNLGLHTADDKEDVIKNRRLVAGLLNSKLTELVAGEQVHGNKIRIVKKHDKGRGAKNYNDSLAGVDALITDQSEVLLASFYADCIPLFFCDTKQGVVALAHAGWQGTLQEIGKKVIEKLITEFNSRLSDLLVAIGPGIGGCCYQVGSEVVGPLRKKFTEAEELLKKDNQGKWLLDLKKANQIQLQKIGLLDKQIIKSNLCTCCNPELFFSYRRDKGRTGRMASLIKLK